MIGVDLARYKLLAFALSSFYAGCAGALLYTVGGVLRPDVVQPAAVGAVHRDGADRRGRDDLRLDHGRAVHHPAAAADPGAAGRCCRSSALGPTEPLNVFQVEAILYGLLIIVFLIFEPRGLFGIWIRIRNYWKAWPFSY